MVYSNRFVACVLVNGTPQKELANGVVPLPFDCEYSLRFRNKHNRRAVVKFTIDDENVSGGGYVINANSSIDIHRHWAKDAKFRFVSLESPDAIDAGKNGPNDDGSKGVIEARFYLEKEWTPPPVYKPVEHHHWHYPPVPWPHLSNPYPQWGLCSGGKGMSAGGLSAGGLSAGGQASVTFTSCNANPPTIPQTINCNANPPTIPQTINCTAPATIFTDTSVFPAVGGVTPPTLQEGCTVEGGLSGQKFSSTWLDLETDYVLVRMVLKGATGQFSAPTGTDYCTACGAKRHKKTDRFCPACGQKFAG
jgi:hypothetical protein